MMQIAWSGKRVKTSHDHAPIAVRHSDWSAWLDGTERAGRMIGRGPTEVEAVEHLLGQLFDQVGLRNALPFAGGREIVLPERARLRHAATAF
jgi:hypothetical protein